MKYIIMYAIMLQSLTGCTYSVNLIHSSGTATDMIDEDQRADPTVNTNISLPIKAL